MKKALSVLFTLLFCSVITFSQTAQTDKKAEDILNGVSKKYKSYKSLKANFLITIENPNDKSKEVQKGTLYLRGNKYKLEIASQDVVSDGSTRWTYVKDANEVQIDIQKNDENSISPSNIFTMYEKGWLYKFTGEQKENGITYQNVELVPVDPKKKNVFKVKLTINKNDKFITTAKMFDKNGNTQTISVEKLSPDVLQDDSIFSFNAAKYPGAEIVDLR